MRRIAWCAASQLLAHRCAARPPGRHRARCLPGCGRAPRAPARGRWCAAATGARARHPRRARPPIPPAADAIARRARSIAGGEQGLVALAPHHRQRVVDHDHRARHAAVAEAETRGHVRRRQRQRGRDHDRDADREEQQIGQAAAAPLVRLGLAQQRERRQRDRLEVAATDAMRQPRQHRGQQTEQRQRSF